MRFLLIFFVIVVMSCSSAWAQKPTTSTAVGDGLSSADNKIIEDAGVSTPRLEDLLGADGKPLKQDNTTQAVGDGLTSKESKILDDAVLPLSRLDHLIGADGRPLNQDPAEKITTNKNLDQSSGGI